MESMLQKSSPNLRQSTRGERTNKRYPNWQQPVMALKAISFFLGLRTASFAENKGTARSLSEKGNEPRFPSVETPTFLSEFYATMRPILRVLRTRSMEPACRLEFEAQQGSMKASHVQAARLYRPAYEEIIQPQKDERRMYSKHLPQERKNTRDYSPRTIPDAHSEGRTKSTLLKPPVRSRHKRSL